LLLLGKSEQFLFGLLEPDLQLLDFVFEEDLGGGIRLETLIEVGGDISISISICNLRRSVR
jgi:hypothetical protein